jgi:hypothetical protein
MTTTNEIRCGAVFPGRMIRAMRQDGRIFVGEIVKTAAYLATDKVKRPGDTLVTVKTGDVHKSIYLGDLTDWYVTIN